MSNKLYDEASIQAIANSIRSKTGSTDTMTVSEMSTAIDGISAGGTPLKWGGANAELVAVHSAEFALSETSFIIGATSSTSATLLKASSTTDERRFLSSSLAVGDKDIVTVQKVLAIPTVEGGTNKQQQIAGAMLSINYVAKRQSNYATLMSRVARGASANFANSLLIYYTSPGSVQVYAASSTTYGLYGIPAVPTLSSATNANTTVTIGTPTLYSRASTTYMTSANMKCITDGVWKWYVEVYLVDSCSTLADAVFMDLGYMCKNLAIETQTIG